MRVIPKSSAIKEKIRARLLQSMLFCHLDETSLNIVIDAMEDKQFSAGATIITQGESGHELYVVEEGTLACFKLFVSYIYTQ
jgi:CRP-like cAMP-binding protein